MFRICSKMRVLFVLSFVAISTILVHSDKKVKSASSEELERLVKAGNADAVKAMYKRQKIRNDKFAFICGCSNIREVNRREFRLFSSDIKLRGIPAVQKWENYIVAGEEPASKLLQELLNKNASGEYTKFGRSVARSYSICCKHIEAVNETVMVVFNASENSTETIFDLLRKEKVEYLITEEDMKNVNLLVKARQMTRIPYTTFQHPNSSITFAIPMVTTLDQCNPVRKDT